MEFDDVPPHSVRRSLFRRDSAANNQDESVEEFDNQRHDSAESSILYDHLTGKPLNLADLE
jgi:hypothetical protein